jgi:hypothetical protein
VKRFFNSCGRQGENISLLAAGVLPECEKIQVQSHLRECAACRQYLEEIKSVTVPLVNWAESLPQIQPDAAAQRRWAKAIEMAGQPETGHGFAPAIRDRMREIFWPWRHVWTGLAAAWLVILAGNVALREPASGSTAKSAVSEQEAMSSFKDQQWILAELLADHSVPQDAERQKFFSPKPRTERFKVASV